MTRDKPASTSISNSPSAARTISNGSTVSKTGTNGSTGSKTGTNGSTGSKTGTNGTGIGSFTVRTGGNGSKKRKLDGSADGRPVTETDKQREERRRLLWEKMRQKKEGQPAGTGAAAKPSPSAPVTKAGTAPAVKPGSSTPAARSGTAPTTKTGYAPPPQKSATFSGATGSSRPSSTASRDRPPTAASGSNSGTKVGEKKLSYTEVLAKAAELQQGKKVPGLISHKARAPIAEKKQWQKNLEARNQATTNNGSAADRKSKSPGLLSTTEKSALVKKPLVKDSKALLSKKSEPDSRRASIAKGRGTSDKARPAAEPVKRKRSPSPISWRGKNASAPVKKPARSGHARSRYDDEEEDEDDDWIVDDDDDGGVGYGARQR